jgi:integrase
MGARGWRERIETGIYRSHRASCASSIDRRPGRRCPCAFEIAVPGARPGSTTIRTVHGGVTDARNHRRQLLAAGRPALASAAVGEESLDEFAAAYFQAKAPVLAESTIKAREEAYRLRISPRLGRTRLAGVSRQLVELWLAETVRSSSPHAARKAVAALRAILKLGVEWGRLPDNPAEGLRLPKREGERPAAERVLTAEQLQALLAATSRVRVETMLRAAGEAGLRLGEVVGLRWPDVDLAARRIVVQRSVWQEAGRDGAPPRRIVRAPKGGRSRRVAIAPTFARRLGAWYAQGVVEGGAEAQGYVWPGRASGPMDLSTPGQALERLQRRAGLLDRSGRPLVTFHGLRHTAASIMLARGVPLIVVSRQLGHANPNITAQVYAHLLSDAQLDDAAAVFEPLTGTETLERTLEQLHD